MKTVPLQGTDGLEADHTKDRYDPGALPAVLAVQKALKIASTLKQQRFYENY